MQPISEHHWKNTKLLGQYYWLVEYWTGPIGMDGVFHCRMPFATATEALDHIEKYAWKQKANLKKVEI